MIIVDVSVVCLDMYIVYSCIDLHKSFHLTWCVLYSLGIPNIGVTVLILGETIILQH